MSVIEAAQAQLQEILREVEGLKFRLIGVHASVPPSPSEADPLQDVDPTDPGARLRGALEYILSDSVGPLLEVLREVTSDPPEPERDEE